MTQMLPLLPLVTLATPVYHHSLAVFLFLKFASGSSSEPLLLLLPLVGAYFFRVITGGS